MNTARLLRRCAPVLLACCLFLCVGVQRAIADAPATMTSPTPGSTLTGSSVTFTWSPGTGGTQFWIWIGTTPGGMELYNHDQSLNTSVAGDGLPTNGIPVYVRLFTVLNGAWQWNDYSYTAATLSSKATMTRPTPESTLTGSSVTFNWSAGAGATQFWMWIGTTPGGMELRFRPSVWLHSTSKTWN